jgi:tetratricopeptide (TPR) repeat protein
MSLITSICLILISLTGLGSVGHLTWKECLRLLVIQIGLTVFYVRLLRSSQEAEEDAEKRRGYAGAVLLALTAIFAMTQFDPATSAANLQGPQKRLNPFFIITTALAGVMGVGFVIARWRELHPRNLTGLDRVALGVALAVVAISLGVKSLPGNPITRSDLLANVKFLSYLCIWFPVTRLYAGPEGGGDAEGGRASGAFSSRWRWALTGISVLFVPAVIYGAYRTGMVFYHFEAGRKLLQAGASETAQKHYALAQKLNERVDLSSLRDDCLHDLAVFRMKQGDAKGAEEAIGTLRGGTYDRAEAHRKVGDVYADAGQWAQAATAYEEFLKTAARNRRVLDRLGEAYLHVGDSQGFLRVIEKYQYVPKVEAQTYEQQVFLGNVQFYRKAFSAALRHFEAAARLRPEDAYATYKVGRAYLEQGRLEEALAQFEKAVKLEPDFADGYYRMGVCHERQGRREEALRMYEKTVELLPNHLDGLLALQRMGR